MRLVAHHAIHHVHAGFLQAIGQADVGFLVEARAQLDDGGDVLAVVRPRSPAHRRWASAAPVRYSVCLMASTCGSAAARRRKSITGAKLWKGWCSSRSPARSCSKMVQGLRGIRGQRGREGRVLQVAAPGQLVDGRQAVQVHRARRRDTDPGVPARTAAAGSPRCLRDNPSRSRGAPRRHSGGAPARLPARGAGRRLPRRRRTGRCCASRGTGSSPVTSMPGNSSGMNSATMFDSSTSEMPLAAVRHRHHARQRTRHLHHGKLGVAAECVLALQLHDEIQALVLDAREGPGRVQAQRAQHRFDFVVEVLLEPGAVRGGPAVAASAGCTPCAASCGQQLLVEAGVLVADQPARRALDGRQLRIHRCAVGAAGRRAAVPRAASGRPRGSRRTHRGCSTKCTGIAAAPAAAATDPSPAPARAG